MDRCCATSDSSISARLLGSKSDVSVPPGITKSFAISLGFRVEGNFGFIDVQITLEIELLSSLVEGALTGDERDQSSDRGLASEALTCCFQSTATATLDRSRRPRHLAEVICTPMSTIFVLARDPNSATFDAIFTNSSKLWPFNLVIRSHQE